MSKQQTFQERIFVTRKKIQKESQKMENDENEK